MVEPWVANGVWAIEVSSIRTTQIERCPEGATGKVDLLSGVDFGIIVYVWRAALRAGPVAAAGGRTVSGSEGSSTKSDLPCAVCKPGSERRALAFRTPEDRA